LGLFQTKNSEIFVLCSKFNITDISRHEKIIGMAVAQAHGTMGVFMENANGEVKRLNESGRRCIARCQI